MSFGALLETEIQDELEKLNDMEVGTEKHKMAVDDIAKLFDRAIELDRLEIEQAEQIKNREIETELRQKQMKEDKVDRWVKNGLTAAGIVLPIGVTIWGTLKSLKFEEEGTVTTIMGRGFINKLLPKK